MKVEVTSFLQKALLFGWGAPLLITVIGVGIWSEFYGGEDFCFVRKQPFFYTILMPVLIVIVFNLSCVCAIGVVLMSSSKVYKSSSMSMRNRVRILTGFVVLFGVTWILGFFVISNNIVAFQYAFCIMCCVQGVYIFLLYGVKKGKQRRCWHKLLKGKNPAEIHRHFLLKAQAGSTRGDRGSGGVISRGISTTSGGMGTSSAQLTSCNSLCADNKITSSRDLLDQVVKRSAASTVRIELKRRSEEEKEEEERPGQPNLHRGESLVGTIVRKFEEMRQRSVSVEKVNRPLLQRNAKSVDWEENISPRDSSDSGQGLGDGGLGEGGRSSSIETNNPTSAATRAKKDPVSGGSSESKGSLDSGTTSDDKDEDDSSVFVLSTSGKTKLLQRQHHFSEV